MALKYYDCSNPDALIWLLTIHTASGDTYLANNTSDIASRGNDYIAWPFMLTLAIDDGERLPAVKITIDNVDRRIIETLRSVTEPPVITLELVVASAPDLVEMTIDNLTLRDFSYNSTNITGTLEAGNVLSRRYPAQRFEPVQYPGLFI